VEYRDHERRSVRAERAVHTVKGDRCRVSGAGTLTPGT
jgi:hypothetical protein